MITASSSGATKTWRPTLGAYRHARPSAIGCWPELFRVAFATNPAVRHVCLRWDDGRGEIGVVEPFLAAGFQLDRSVVLTAHAPSAPAHPNTAATIRTLRTDRDWEAAT